MKTQAKYHRLVELLQKIKHSGQKCFRRCDKVELKRYIGKIMAENFPFLARDIKVQIQEDKQTQMK